MTDYPLASFRDRGWASFGYDPDTSAWVAAAAPVAAALAADPAQRAAWLRCGDTWFAGVNVFPNGPDGSVPDAGVPSLSGAAMRFVRDALGFPDIALDCAQISICYAGYPQPWSGESEAAFRFRARRDAAHVDGLLRDDARRRRIGEAHAFVLGLPLTEAPEGAAPFVVWEGSHELMRAAFSERLEGIPPARWGEEDVTDAYAAARSRAFETCARVEISAKPGEAYVCHRLLLHGVAPWTATAEGPERSIAYFRPEPPVGLSEDWWITRP